MIFFIINTIYLPATLMLPHALPHMATSFQKLGEYPLQIFKTCKIRKPHIRIYIAYRIPDIAIALSNQHEC